MFYVQFLGKCLACFEKAALCSHKTIQSVAEFYNSIKFTNICIKMAWFLICMKINCHSSQLSLSNQAVHLSCNSCHCALDTQLFGVIHQQCGPNFTQFWPSTPLEWTNGEILHTTYHFVNATKRGLSRFYWPPTYLLFSTY